MPKKEKPEGIVELEMPSQPFSLCVKIGKNFHFSGTVGEVKDGQVVGDLDEQLDAIFSKMLTALAACDLSVEDIYSATILLSGDMSGYGVVNTEWETMFSVTEIKPRRKAYAVAALPFGALVEIEFDAIRQCDGNGCSCHDLKEDAEVHPGD
ncbi:hypothetical protein C0580_02725 [Candidatus Parcubacteria bacterium]|nr:MAG: hypothetical protein C0580_02725 [Candidatus Parcubacteria bacterium]